MALRNSLKQDRSHFDLDQLYLIFPLGALLCVHWLCLCMSLHNKGDFLRLDCALQCLPNTHTLYVFVGVLCMCLLIVCVFTLAGWGEGSKG